MKPATPSQFQQALALIRATQDHARQIRVLESLIQAQTSLINARRRQQLSEINFCDNPDRLAHLIARIRHADPSFLGIAESSYHHLLLEMRERFDAGKPLRVDFHTLHPDARPYLLAPFLDLVIGGRFPRLCLTTSDPDRGRLSYIAAHGALDRNHLHQRLPDINAWLGGSWRIASTDATSFVLERMKPLPATLHFDPAWLRKGALLLGINTETREPAFQPFDHMTHLLIAGTPGMGKSSFLHLLMHSCLNSAEQFDRIIAVCGQGIAFESYRGLHPKLHIASEPEEL
ncbi:MAG: hypothetical protein KDJ66_06385, partial [Nitratireductor sp.]|nr:hypothetical protein [Nitratireductor sp.]